MDFEEGEMMTLLQYLLCFIWWGIFHSEPGVLSTSVPT